MIGSCSVSVSPKASSSSVESTNTNGSLDDEMLGVVQKAVSLVRAPKFVAHERSTYKDGWLKISLLAGISLFVSSTPSFHCHGDSPSLKRPRLGIVE